MSDVILGLAFSPDGNTLAVATQPIGKGSRRGGFNVASSLRPGSIFLFDLPASTRKTVIKPQLAIYLMMPLDDYEPSRWGCAICGAISLNNDSRVSAISADGTVMLWESISGDLIATISDSPFKGDLSQIGSFSSHDNFAWFSSDGAILAAAEYGRLTSLFRAADGARIFQNIDNRIPMSKGAWGDPVTSEFFTHLTGVTIVAGRYGPFGLARTLDWREWTSNMITAKGSSIAISSDGKRVLAYQYTLNAIQVWETEGTGSSTYSIVPPPQMNGRNLFYFDFRAAFSADNNRIALFSLYGEGDGDDIIFTQGKNYQGHLTLWDIRSKKRLLETVVPVFDAKATTFSRQGDKVAYVASEDTVEVLDLLNPDNPPVTISLTSEGTPTSSGGFTSMPANNLLKDPGFEGGWVAGVWTGGGWQPGGLFSIDGSQVHSGQISGGFCSTTANDLRFFQTVAVEPMTDYLLTGWLKTSKVVHDEGPVPVGANLSLLELMDHTPALIGDNDWTHVVMEFNSHEYSSLTVACRLGFYSATAHGCIWCDDLELRKK